ncbi:hypothetical protein DPEC_G00195710 [Dallia pectoralis]|uniref:Uncharacterized protein n=1 Tax=Dallia pectoralis TaxID=75939 RepID=A0ACC2G7J8_DALPE|nr:hypothetical protein DPEC_G00195710 [Dallia pectoralis]
MLHRRHFAPSGFRASAPCPSQGLGSGLTLTDVNSFFCLELRHRNASHLRYAPSSFEAPLPFSTVSTPLVLTDSPISLPDPLRAVGAAVSKPNHISGPVRGSERKCVMRKRRERV